jgi:hypothetical protein
MGRRFGGSGVGGHGHWVGGHGHRVGGHGHRVGGHGLRVGGHGGSTRCVELRSLRRGAYRKLLALIWVVDLGGRAQRSAPEGGRGPYLGGGLGGYWKTRAAGLEVGGRGEGAAMCR